MNLSYLTINMQKLMHLESQITAGEYMYQNHDFSIQNSIRVRNLILGENGFCMLLTISYQKVINTKFVAVVWVYLNSTTGKA